MRRSSNLGIASRFSQSLSFSSNLSGKREDLPNSQTISNIVQEAVTETLQRISEKVKFASLFLR